MYRVLVVDDDRDLRQIVASALSEHHYQVDQAVDGEEAVNRVKAGNYHLVLLDVNMPRLSGLQALKEIKAHDASIIAIMLTAFSNVRDAVEATKEGAYNYLEKPIKADNLVYLVDKALKAHSMVKNLSLSAPVFAMPNGTEFIGGSEMKRIFNVIDKLAKVDTAVLIRGESGTGKELVAQALHYNGPRKDQRFVTINCSAIPENLIESEFFGHEKGSFTGADSRKIGKFQYADSGTLFLDEIGDISAGMQVKLLRALQEKRFTPVGSNREVEVNVRIVAATNRNLEQMMKTGEFREDLYYRLNVLPIHLPPLRERKTDIRQLVSYFVEKFNVAHAKHITGVTSDAMSVLEVHEWPGNIRELENVIERSFVLENTNEITVASLPPLLQKLQGQTQSTALASSLSFSAASANSVGESPESDDESMEDGLKPMGESPTLGITLELKKLDFQLSKEEFEKQFLISALKAFKGKINQTALHANIPKKTLLRKLEKYGITAKEYSAP